MTLLVLYGSPSFDRFFRGTNSRVHHIDDHAVLSVTGFPGDGRDLAVRARAEAKQWKNLYSVSIPPSILAERLALYIHAHTLSWSVRPFGASVLLGCKDENEFCLFALDPSGGCYRYRGMAFGKGNQIAKIELEAKNFIELKVEDCLQDIAK